MKRELIAVLIGLAVGLLAGLAWQGHRAAQAETRAHRADSLYQATKVQDALERQRQAAADSARADSLTLALASLAASRDTVASIRVRAQRTTASVAGRLAAAVTVEQQRDTYKSLYEETTVQRDDALAAADSANAAAGRFLGIIRADSLELQRRTAWGNGWKRAADSLDLANADLMAHRRPAFSLRVGVGGFALGAIAATVVRTVVK